MKVNIPVVVIFLILMTNIICEDRDSENNLRSLRGRRSYSPTPSFTPAQYAAKAQATQAYHNTENQLKSLGASYNSSERVFVYTGPSAQAAEAQRLASLAATQRQAVTNTYYAGRSDPGHANAVSALTNMKVNP